MWKLQRFLCVPSLVPLPILLHGGDDGGELADIYCSLSLSLSRCDVRLVRFCVRIRVGHGRE